jgi:hypothetical protein
MDRSPIDPEDIRAAAEAHRELGSDYSDAVVASFLDKVDREITARVAARLADTSVVIPAKRENRRMLLKGMAIGAGAGALAAGIAVGAFAGSAAAPAHPANAHARTVPVPKAPGVKPQPAAPEPRRSP